MLPATPSVEQLSSIIGNVAAPAFLLGAVAAFISVLISRMNRVIDRSQVLHGIADGDAAKSYLKKDIVSSVGPRCSTGRYFIPPSAPSSRPC